MTPNERAAPEHLTVEQACAVMRQAYQLGWISTRDGNVSVAMTDRRGFLVSGSGLIKHALVPTQFVLIPTGGAPARRQIPRPSGELELHRRLQALFSSQHLTVLHLHPTHIVAALYAGHRLARAVGRLPGSHPLHPGRPRRTRAACHQRGAGRGLRSGLPPGPWRYRPTSSGSTAMASSRSARHPGRPLSTWSAWNTSAASPWPPASRLPTHREPAMRMPANPRQVLTTGRVMMALAILRDDRLDPDCLSLAERFSLGTQIAGHPPCPSRQPS